MNSYYEKMADGTGAINCIDDEIPFDIPNSWEWCRLGHLFSHNTGKALNGTGGKGSPHKYLTTSNVYWNSFDFNKIKVMNFTDAELDKYTIQKGDLLVCEGGDIGRAAIWSYDYDICIQNHIHRLRSYVSINTEFFFYIFLLYKGLGLIGGKGIGIQGLSSGALHNILIPVSPINEQTRIVEKLQSLQVLIDKYIDSHNKFDLLNSSINSNLKKSILQEAIQGRLVPQIASEGTAEELLEEIEAEKKRLVKEGKLKKSALTASRIFRGDDNRYYEQIGSQVFDITDEIPFELPKSWSWTRMGYIGDWGAGATPLRGEKGFFNGEILWLKTGELNNDYIFDTEEKITDKALKECSLRLNQIGDILIAMYGATIGKLGIVGKELTTNQACCGCTPFIYNLYLFYFLMASKKDFVKRGEGGAQPNISRIKLVNYLIPLPPLAEQKRIVTQIERLFERIK